MINKGLIGQACPIVRHTVRNLRAHRSSPAGVALALLCLWILVWGVESGAMAAAKLVGVQEHRQSKIGTKHDAGDKKDLFAFDQREIVQPQLLAPDSVSGTTISNSLSILLTGAQISLQGPDAPLVKTYVGIVRVPFVSPEQGSRIKYNQSLRGGVHKDADAKVAIFLDLGGKSYKLEYLTVGRSSWK